MASPYPPPRKHTAEPPGAVDALMRLLRFDAAAPSSTTEDKTAVKTKYLGLFISIDLHG